MNNGRIMKKSIVYMIMAGALVLTSCTEEKKGEDEKKVGSVLFIGDSITDGGWGNSCGDMRPSGERNHTDMNHIYGHSYMMLCASAIQSELPERDIKCYNRGISGNTLYDMAARWNEDAVALGADVVSILIGTNDVENYVGSGDSAPFNFERWEATYRGLLDTLRMEKPGVGIVLCKPFVEKVGWRGEAENYQVREFIIGRFGDVVERIGKDYGAVVVRFDELFRTLRAVAPRADYWIWDGVHPTPAGHRRMADLWLERVRGAMGL